MRWLLCERPGEIWWDMEKARTPERWLLPPICQSRRAYLHAMWSSALPLMPQVGKDQLKNDPRTDTSKGYSLLRNRQVVVSPNLRDTHHLRVCTMLTQLVGYSGIWKVSSPCLCLCRLLQLFHHLGLLHFVQIASVRARDPLVLQAMRFFAFCAFTVQQPARSPPAVQRWLFFQSGRNWFRIWLASRVIDSVRIFFGVLCSLVVAAVLTSDGYRRVSCKGELLGSSCSGDSGRQEGCL